MKRTRLNPVNTERRAKTRERAFGDKGSWIRAHPCLVRGCRKPHTQAAHAIAQGMHSAKGDLRHLVPLCWLHHMAAGEYRTAARIGFETSTGLDRGHPGEGLVIIAAEYHERWLAGVDYGAPF